MIYLLSVDPGLRKSGVALWRRGGLVFARLIEPKSDGPEISDVVEAMMSSVCGWILRDCGAGDPTGSRTPWLRLVCERPRTYGGRVSGNADANDLIAVALVAGAILGRLGCPAALPLPEDWKGGISKPKTKAQYERDGYPVEERARGKLSPSELACVEWPRDWKKRLDVADAIGIGLWALGR